MDCLLNQLNPVRDNTNSSNWTIVIFHKPFLPFLSGAE